MYAEPIKVPYGETLRHTFECFGLGCDKDRDAALFVIRDKKDNVVFWKILKPVLDQEQNVWTFPLTITHSESENIPAGSYKYGLTFYKGYVDGAETPEIPEEPDEETEIPSLDSYQLTLDDVLEPGDGEEGNEAGDGDGDEEPEVPVEPAPDKPTIEPIELDGDVKVLIAKKNFIVLEAVAREDGISRPIEDE